MKFVKILLAIAATTTLVNVATASTVFYGAPPQSSGLTALNSTAAQTLGYGSIYNHTNQTYVVNAQFFPTGKYMNNRILNPQGSIDPASGQPSDVLSYRVDYPDTYVCISATRYSDGIIVVPTTCLVPERAVPNKRIDIGPTLAAANLPSLSIIK
jgi:hypothetical protein